MMSGNRDGLDERPTAEEMLARVRAEGGDGRGRLRRLSRDGAGRRQDLSMLEEAHRRVERGTDLVVGFVEAHGRPHTIEQLEGLEIIPRRRIEYRGVIVEEMDTDAIIARHPTVALVDELAHTNAPGLGAREALAGRRGDPRCRHPRHQHAATSSTSSRSRTPSPRSPVRRSTSGCRTRSSTLPDEVELVDMSPHALRQRMRHGNVYPPDRTQVALDRFFTEPNLTALRELALRFTAGRVDEQLRDIMSLEGIKRTWPVTTRLAVIIDDRSSVRAILRHAAELAATMRGELIALAVDTPADVSRGHDRGQDLRENLEFAEELGAEVVRQEAPSLIDGVVEAVKRRQVTHLVLPYEPTGRLAGLLRRPFAEQLMERLPEVEVLLIGERGPAPV